VDIGGFDTSLQVFLEGDLEKCTARTDRRENKEGRDVAYERLRQARELKGWSVDDLARRTGIRAHTLAAVERGDFDELPPGVYCRSSIRSYATAVGLNPDEVMQEIAPLLPVLEDPLDGLARRYGHARKSAVRPADVAPAATPAAALPLALDASPIVATPPAAGARVLDRLAATPAAIADRLVASRETSDDVASGLVMRREAPAGHAAADVLLTNGERERAAAAVPPMFEASSSARRTWWRPVVASCIDGALLATLGAALVWLTAAACGATVLVTLRVAAPGIALVFALIVSLYFVLFSGVGNATPGVAAMGLDLAPTGRTVLHARDVFGRARRSVFRDSMLLD
jgi:transcriptional regulator with XRE-family HTH domain